MSHTTHTTEDTDMNRSERDQAKFDKWAKYAATATPAGTEPDSMDARDIALDIAIKRLDDMGVEFSVDELCEAVDGITV
jgi:hypothetical protein